jgi:hypothetical protein
MYSMRRECQKDAKIYIILGALHAKKCQGRQTILPSLPQDLNACPEHACRWSSQILGIETRFPPTDSCAGGQPQAKALFYLTCNETLMTLTKLLRIQTG